MANWLTISKKLPIQNMKELENERSIGFKLVLSTLVNHFHMEALTEGQISLDLPKTMADQTPPD